METTKRYSIKVTREYVTYIDVVATSEEDANNQLQEMIQDGRFYDEEMSQCEIQGEEVYIYQSK